MTPSPAASIPSSRGRCSKRGLSQWPERLPEKLDKNKAYYLFDNPVDWYHGTVRCLLGTVPRAVDELCASVNEVLSNLKQCPPSGLDGLIVMVDENPDGSGYLLCWEHWAEGTAPESVPLRNWPGWCPSPSIRTKPNP